jgi:hypothetical protein
MAIDVSAVLEEFGVYINHGQNRNNLVKKLYQPTVTASYFRNTPTENDVLRYSEAFRNRILQPFQKAFTPVGDIEFTPNPIPLFKLKIDDAFHPDDLEGTWLGFLASLEETERTKWPFVRWYIEEHVFPAIWRDHENNEIFQGVRTEPTPLTAGGISTSLNGIKTIINTGIDTDLIDPIVISGTFPTDGPGMVEYVTKLIAGVPHLYRRELDYVFMSEDNALLFRQGMREEYNMNYEQAQTDRVIDYPNIRVVGLPSHAGSNKMWTTTAMNRVRGIKAVNRLMNFDMQKFDRQVKLLGDWWEGIGFVIPGIVFTNDQDLSGGGE